MDFSGREYIGRAPDCLYQDDVRRAFLYARALDAASYLADGARRIFLAGDYVCLYDAGLPDALDYRQIN